MTRYPRRDPHGLYKFCIGVVAGVFIALVVVICAVKL